MATTTSGECFFRPRGEDQATKPVTDGGSRRIKSIGQAMLKSEYRELLVICMQLMHGIMKTASHHLWHLIQHLCVGCQRDPLLLLCSKSCKLCQVWALLFAVYGESPQRYTCSFHEG